MIPWKGKTQAPPTLVTEYLYWLEVKATIVGGVNHGLVLEVVGGQLEQDSAPPVRRRADAVFAAPALATDAEVQDMAEALVAGGVWVALDWTVRLMDERVWSLRVGTLRVETAQWAPRAGTITCTLLDAGQAVDDDRFLRPATLSGPSKVDVIGDLLAAPVPGYAVEVDPAVNDSPLVETTWDESRAGAVADLARAMGCWLFWKASGGWMLRPVPTGEEPPVWQITTADLAVNAGGSAGRDQTYNAVVAFGQADAADPNATPPYAIVYDTDPASPTFWDGPFGHKPRFYSSPALATDEQCERAAASILSQSKGLTRAFTLEAAAHPGLEPGDVILFNGAERYMVDTLTLPFNGDVMKCGVRLVGAA